MKCGLLRSMIPSSVSLSVTRGELCKNGWTDRRPVWDGDSWRPQKTVFNWGLHPPRRGEGCMMTHSSNFFDHLQFGVVNTGLQRCADMYQRIDILRISAILTDTDRIRIVISLLGRIRIRILCHGYSTDMHYALVLFCLNLILCIVYIRRHTGHRHKMQLKVIELSNTEYRVSDASLRQISRESWVTSFELMISSLTFWPFCKRLNRNK